MTIDTAHGMEYSMDDKDMYKDMIQMFIDQREQNLSDINGFFEKKDWDNYRIIAHSLKGNALTVGALRLSEHAKELEFAARDNRIDEIMEKHEPFQKEHRALLDAIDARAKK